MSTWLTPLSPPLNFFSSVSCAGVPQVARVLSEVYGDRMTTSVNGEGESIPLQQKLLVCCFLLLTCNAKTKEMPLGKVRDINV